MTQRGLAAPCSASPEGKPCTPDPNATTLEAKKNILNLLVRAKADDPDIKKLRAAYLAARENPNISAEDKLAACEPYYKAQTMQDNLYREAIDKTEALYHVHPIANVLTVAKPIDPSLDWMTGIRARWDPHVTDSGPGSKLAYALQGNDRVHYGGKLDIDPKSPNGAYAFTLPDGRVFFAADTFEIVLEKAANKSARRVDSDPVGFLAAIIYHETRHFNRLVEPPPGSKEKQSWGSREQEEFLAYLAQGKMASVFGLSKTDIQKIETQRDAYLDKINRKDVTSSNPSPGDEANWKSVYEGTWNGGGPKQINLEEEYEKLKRAVKENKTKRSEEDRRQDGVLDASLHELAAKLCANPNSVAQEDIDRLGSPINPGPFHARGISDSDGTCADTVYRAMCRGIGSNGISLNALRLYADPPRAELSASMPPPPPDVPAAELAAPPEDEEAARRAQQAEERTKVIGCLTQLQGLARDICSSGGASADQSRRYYSCFMYLAKVGPGWGAPPKFAEDGLSGCDAAVTAGIRTGCNFADDRNILHCIGAAAAQACRPAAGVQGSPQSAQQTRSAPAERHSPDDWSSLMQLRGH